jgi:GT2 family glycosyltransferase
VKLAALVVNHDSGPHALECVRSLRAESRAAGLPSPRIVVVDCGSTVDQREAFEGLRALGAEVLLAANLGYAGGMQLASSRAAGAEAVLALNPDLVFTPGSLARMLEASREEPRAIVAPRTCIDEGGALLLPPIEMPGAWRELRQALAGVDSCVARDISLLAARRRISAWTAKAAHRAEMLSGACLLVPRATLLALGLFLDERYPLYYEDADLCRRARAHGIPLVVEPRALVAHRWSRSAGHGARYAGEPLRRMRLSRELYLREHHGTRGLLAARLVALLEARAQAVAIHACRELGSIDADPASGPPGLFEAGPGEESLFEVAVSPGFGLCAGRVLAPFERPGFGGAWDWLPEGRYWMRRLATSDLRLLGAWTFHKSSASIEPAARGGAVEEAA